MKRVALAILLFLFTLSSFADHLKGGWIYYEYLGVGDNANTSKYKITVKQYMRCDATGGQLDPDRLKIGVKSTTRFVISV